MARKLLLSLLAALLLTGAAWAEEDMDAEEIERALYLKQKELELLELKNQLEHRNRLRALELKSQEAEVDGVMERADRVEGLERELDEFREKFGWYEGELEKAKNRRHHGGGGGAAGVFLLVCFVVNLLLAIWVYTDIRKRDQGSGIWIVVTLLAGFFGALIYAVVRMGDDKAANNGPVTRSRKGS